MVILLFKMNIFIDDCDFLRNAANLVNKISVHLEHRSPNFRAVAKDVLSGNCREFVGVPFKITSISLADAERMIEVITEAKY